MEEKAVGNWARARRREAELAQEFPKGTRVTVGSISGQVVGWWASLSGEREQLDINVDGKEHRLDVAQVRAQLDEDLRNLVWESGQQLAEDQDRLRRERSPALDVPIYITV